jgi:hypothetical protein
MEQYILDIAFVITGFVIGYIVRGMKNG